jgi:serine/threonine protein kinase
MNLNSPETTSTPIDLTGRQLGDYELFRRLGRGGMADVYLAKQNSLNRKVALKILKPELAKDDSYVQRFRQEAQAAANLIQANIVQIYEVGESDGFYFIAQEYIQGRNLNQYLARHGAVEPVMAINVLRQCAMALQKAGELHVIHRDIKPENIMLSTKGEVKITDFGLARINNQATDQALTQIGVTMGTPLYMSPEQVEGRAVDQRSDIYSLGVTAYHMLAGSPPFDGDNALAIALQHVKDQPASIANLRPDIPEELGDIIERMMAKQQDDRPADARQLLKDLRKIKIDVDDDWEMIVEKLSTAESVSLEDSTTWSQSKLAATRQLQAVMKGNVRSWWKSPGTIAALTALSVVSLFSGWMLATQTAPESLLDVEQISSSAIPRMATVNEQYVEAQLARYRYDPEVEEQFWLAVEKFFNPENALPEEQNSTRLTIRNSKARLGEFYLTHNRFADAMPIYDEFVGYEDLAEDFRVVGHAGLAIVYDSMQAEEFEGGVDEKMAKVRAEIGEVGTRVDLLNKFMIARFQNVKNRLDEESVQPEDVQEPQRDS